MFCKDCGAELAQDSRFCPHCGSEQAIIPPAEPIQSFADKVRSAAKKVGSSTAFLIATICLTFAQIFGLLYPFAGFTGTVLTAGHSLYKLASVIDIIGMIPSILITLGLWITFFSCASRKTKVNTSGLTMIFVVTLVQMVVSCLALLAACIPLAAMYSGAYNLLLDKALVEAIVLAVGLILLIVFIFALIYYSKVCITISNIRSTLKTGVPNKKASRFVAILCYIGGGILILSGIFSLLSSMIVPLNGYYDETVTYELHSEIFLSAATSLLTATAQIIFGALIFNYRRKMAVLEEEDRLTTFQTLSYAEPYTAPVYIPPEPAKEELDETKRWDL